MAWIPCSSSCSATRDQTPSKPDRADCAAAGHARQRGRAPRNARAAGAAGPAAARNRAPAGIRRGRSAGGCRANGARRRTTRRGRLLACERRRVRRGVAGAAQSRARGPCRRETDPHALATSARGRTFRRAAGQHRGGHRTGRRRRCPHAVPMRGPGVRRRGHRRRAACLLFGSGARLRLRAGRACRCARGQSTAIASAARPAAGSDRRPAPAL